MKVGMLWLDLHQGESLSHRVTAAATYYREKYGRTPNLCYVNPLTEGGELPSVAGGLQIRTDSAVQPAHFWLGVRETGELD